MLMRTPSPRRSDAVPGLPSATSTLLDALRWLSVSIVCVPVTMGAVMVIQRKFPPRLATLAIALFLVFVAGSALLAGAYGYAGRVPQYSGFAPALFGLFFYFYADRRYLSVRSRWLGLFYTVAVIGPLGKPGNPTSLAGHAILFQIALHVLNFIGDVLAVLIVCSAIIPQVYGRIKRPLPPNDRTAPHWLGQASGVLATAFLALLLVVAISPPDAHTPVPPIALLVVRAAPLTLLALLPVVAAFALARGQRYDRAALVRHATIYGALITVLAVLYAASLVAIHLLYTLLFALPPAYEPDLAQFFLVLTALLLIAIYGSLRPWLRTLLDQRFFPRAHAVTQALAAFQAALRGPLAPADLYEQLATTVRRAVAPDLTLLWGRISASDAARITERAHATARVASLTGEGATGPEPAAPGGTYLLQLYAQPEPAEPQAANIIAIAPGDPLALTLAPEIGPVALAALPSRSAAGHALLHAGVALALPLARPAGTVGLLGLGPRADGAAYSFDDREFLAACAELAAPPLYDAQERHTQEAEERERERVEQELRTAQRIQQALLPRATPTLEGWRLATFYQPAREVGGDFYDFLSLPGGRLGLVLGDVSGKGIPAALIMATTRSMLRAVAATADEAAAPGAVLRRVNQLLCGDLPGGTFVTCFYGLLDPASGTLRFANAGQDLPALRRADSSVCELRATGMPLGLMPESAYEEREAQIDRGASILFYSDGLVEAHNARREMFGFARLASAIGADPGGAPAISALLRDLASFAGATWEQEDDITLVTLERAPQTEPTLAASAPDVAAAP
jgi:serine phosphatase RsbU (regulator of sigma subunit)